MAKFELEYNGERYEVEAPDEQSALSAFQSQIVNAQPSTEQRYQGALETVRRSQFPGMSDAEWQDYSSKFLGPQGFQGIAQQGQTFGFADLIAEEGGAVARLHFERLLRGEVQMLPFAQPELDDDIDVHTEGKRSVDVHGHPLRIALLRRQPGDRPRLQRALGRLFFVGLAHGSMIDEQVKG